MIVPADRFFVCFTSIVSLRCNEEAYRFGLQMADETGLDPDDDEYQLTAELMRLEFIKLHYPDDED